MSIHTTKRLLAALIAIVFTVAIAKAQAPQKMSFQSIVRNSSGVLVTNHSVGLRLSILQGSISGTAVYVETQTATSNANGLVTLQIGGGTVVSGTFSSIDWSAGPYYIKSEIDPTGGTSYGVVGTTQLLSVAYALYANTAGSLGGGSGAHMAVYSSNGTFKVPHGVTSVIVELWGAGGGGGNYSGCPVCGGGGAGIGFSGGGGGYGKQSLTVVSDSIYNVTVGAGGVGISQFGGCAGGGSGGTTSFANLYATGGSGGYWCNYSCSGICNNGVTGGTSNALISLSGDVQTGASGGSNYGYGYGTGAGENGNGTSGAVIIYW